MSEPKKMASEWQSVRWFATYWNVHPKTASRWLCKVHALQGVPRIGSKNGLRYPVDLVEKAILKQEN